MPSDCPGGSCQSFSCQRLGLAICRALAWHNGGSLEIESAPGRGTRVAVGLRLAADPAQAEPPERRASEAWA
jgi:K+-sensing histidine kinase KdpD